MAIGVPHRQFSPDSTVSRVPAAGAPQRPLTPTLARRLEEAVALHRGGDLAGAARLYEAVLRERPAQSDALHMLGVLHHQQGDSARAVSLIRKALRTDPGNASCHINLGAALLGLGRHGEAEAVLVEAAKRLPESPEVHANLAAVKHAAGSHADALLHLRRALALNPANPALRRRLADYAGAAGDYALAAATCRELLALDPQDIAIRNDLGVALEKLGRFDEAAAAYSSVLELAPDLAEAHSNLGNAKARMGDLGGAERHFRHGWMLKPEDWRFGINLANLLWETSRVEEGDSIYRAILQAQPENAQLWQDLGSRLVIARRFEQARAAFETAIAIDPALATAHNGLGNLRANLGDYDGAIAAYEKAVGADPNYLLAHINLVLALQQEKRLDEAAFRAYGLKLLPGYDAKICDGRTLQVMKLVCDFDGIETLGDIWTAAAEMEPQTLIQMLLTLLAMAEDEPELRQLVALAGRIGAEEEAKLQRAGFPAPAVHRRPGRIRLGFVSSDFRNHSAAKCIRPLFDNLDRDRFEMHCYSAVPAAEDPVQQALAAKVDSFRPIDGMTDIEAAKLVRSDEIDVLFDLNGWTAHSRLHVFAHRPAPHQVAWLGWPFTTGFRSVGHFMVDRFNDPTLPDLMTERPLRLPDGPWIAFQPLTEEPVGPAPFAAAGHVTFGTLNNTYKITPTIVALWSEVLTRVPGSRFLLVRPEARSAMLVHNLLQEFARHGIPADRIDLVGQPRDTRTHFPYYNRIDIALDSFPVTGGITTIDSLWMGVPVVSLHGPAFHQRISHSLLGHAGFGDLSHAAPAGFVGAAVSLAGDPGRLAAMRLGLRDRLLASPLFDGAAFARNFGEAAASLVRS